VVTAPVSRKLGGRWCEQRVKQSALGDVYVGASAAQRGRRAASPPENRCRRSGIGDTRERVAQSSGRGRQTAGLLVRGATREAAGRCRPALRCSRGVGDIGEIDRARLLETMRLECVHPWSSLGKHQGWRSITVGADRRSINDVVSQRALLHALLALPATQLSGDRCCHHPPGRISYFPVANCASIADALLATGSRRLSNIRFLLPGECVEAQRMLLSMRP
jgi:hypothetical protein